jgi:hypothetical protein
MSQERLVAFARSYGAGSEEMWGKKTNKDRVRKKKGIKL